MDHIDRKIIDILQNNARSPLKEIADHVFLSSPAVSARIARLESSGTISGYQAQVDAPKLGYMVKAYGHVYPVTPALYAALESALHDALNDDEDVPLLCQEGDMARISMEGSYFPEDEVVEAFRAHLTPDMQGKLDVLDMDGWRLTRHVFTGGQVKSSSAPLNNVLDYSGH